MHKTNNYGSQNLLLQVHRVILPLLLIAALKELQASIKGVAPKTYHNKLLKDKRLIMLNKLKNTLNKKNNLETITKTMKTK